MITVKNIRLPLKYTDDSVCDVLSRVLKISRNSIISANISRLSVDARKKNDVHYIASIDAEIDGNEKKLVDKNKNAHISVRDEYCFPYSKSLKTKPVVIGSGPAGLFCALMLARAGASPIIIERGEPVEKRTETINTFWQKGKLDIESNVQFGEGGAGTFSDGKLNTGTNDIRSRFILKEFVRHGAPEEILISAKPHIGTDKLKPTIIAIRKEIESLGGEFHFNTKFTDILLKDGKLIGVKTQCGSSVEVIDTEYAVLAIGHSARDTFELLRDRGIEMQQKAFSIGARIEHLRADVDECQYGKARHFLPAADYKLSTHLGCGRGVYTFCMCPGGYVVNASSENGLLCTNGMSCFARDNVNSNSALLVGVLPEDYNCGDVLDGMKLQRQIERSAYELTKGYFAPVQRVGDFLGINTGRKSNVEPSIKPGYSFCDISKIYPEFISDSMKEGIIRLSEKMSVFEDMGAVLTAAETRSSSPVRILRNETYQSVSCIGLYPCGEGAGYAGGIMSAAADGIKCAEAIFDNQK
ncbi:MAG: FAD-binding protein [Clostridia bacterium]|nr:FAD-binding protein [Clostridia bacterium]